MRTILTIAIAALLESSLLLAQPARNAEVELKAAQQKAEVEGNLKAAIEQYRAIASKYARSDRAAAATALVRSAECHSKLGDAEAKRVLEQVVRDYSDQKEPAALARVRLERLGKPSAPLGGLTAREVMADFDPWASITPDARWVASTDWTVGDLMLRDLQTGVTTRLGLNSDVSGGKKVWNDWAESPLLSPDRRQVVYNWYHGTGYQLRVADAVSGAKQRILVGSPDYVYFGIAGWSPDGKAVLVSAGKSDRSATQLAWVSLPGGTMKVLKTFASQEHTGRASLSPDGRYIAYDVLQSPGSTRRRIFVMAADGSRETPLLTIPASNHGALWTPDGSHLLFLSDLSGSAGLWSVSMRDAAADRSPELVKADIGDIRPLAMSRDGAYYYIHAQGTQNIFSAGLDPSTGKLRGKPARLIENYVGLNARPAWSPDGRWIAYQSSRAGIFDRDAATLVTHSVESGEEKTFRAHGFMGTQPAWSADSQSLLQQVGGSGGVHLFRADLKNGEFKSVVATGARYNTGGVLSPDGQTAYCPCPSDKMYGGLVAFDIATGQHRTLFTAPASATLTPSVALSPDGRTIAFTLRKGQQLHPATIGVNGEGFREFDIELAQPGLVAWSGDGRSLYFVRSGSAAKEVWRVPATGGTPEFTGLSGAIGDLTLSRDGTRIAYTANPGPARTALWTLEHIPAALRSAQ